jgi:hypothetical protein
MPYQKCETLGRMQESLRQREIKLLIGNKDFVDHDLHLLA